MSRFAHIPVSALYDGRLSDGELRSLGKLFEFIWQASPDDMRSPPLHWSKFAEILGVSKATYFRRIHYIEGLGYIETISSGIDRTIIRASLTVSGLRPTTKESLKDSLVLKDSLSSLSTLSTLSSSRSHSLNSETDHKDPSLTPETEKEVELFYKSSIDTLRAAGVGEPARSRIAKEIHPDLVRAHIVYAELRGDSVRLLIHRLINGDPIPDQKEIADLDPDSPEARQAYLKGWVDV